MITERDRMILKHIDEHGFITLKEACDIAYQSIGYGYDYARRRFKKLIEWEMIKVKKSYILGVNIYYIDSAFCNPSYHRVLLYDYYCKLIGSGAEIEVFKKEKEWCDGKVRSDALCIYTFGGSRFYNLVEVNVSRNKLNLKRFEKMIPEFQQEFNIDITPTMVLIDDTKHKVYDTNEFSIVRVNYDMSNISEIFV